MSTPNPNPTSNKINAVIALANAALILTGQSKLTILTELFKVSAEAYQDFHGKPVDVALIPPYERIT